MSTSKKELPTSSKLSDLTKRHGVSLSTLYREVKAGKLIVMKIGRSTRVNIEDELNWLESCKNG